VQNKKFFSFGTLLSFELRGRDKIKSFKNEIENKIGTKFLALEILCDKEEKMKEKNFFARLSYKRVEDKNI
jgi:hypothetical protein